MSMFYTVYGGDSLSAPSGENCTPLKTFEMLH